MVQQQLAELKEFKRELYQCKVDVESLRHQAGLGSAGHGEPPAPLSDFRQRWDRLEEEIVSRQHQLEAALLGLGQFQHQLEELLQWLSPKRHRTSMAPRASFAAASPVQPS
nr:PREDICTED: microtubule-actin cross-linking factor 1-like [Struthio camelus australis]